MTDVAVYQAGKLYRKMQISCIMGNLGFRVFWGVALARD